jgi:putative two-component system hydrogenase maturation factor HypX/HoxX
MGGLYGSEYWTYLLPKRVGHALATQITDERLPISAKKAWRIGMVDKVLDDQHSIFVAQIKHLVNTFLTDNNILKNLLREKANTRCLDEAKKPLAAYQKFELTQMYANFYGDHAYHKARHNFVFKKPACKTPMNLAIHRQNNATNAEFPSSLVHFVSQDLYSTIGKKTDNNYNKFYLLVEKLLTSVNKEAMLDNMFDIYQHVKEKFREEEHMMKQAEFHDYKNHVKEHHLILDKLLAMDVKIQHDNCKTEDIQKLIDRWTTHVSNLDATFDQFNKINPISKRMLSQF